MNSLPTSPYHPCSHQSIFCIWICLFGTFRINGLLQYVIVCDWLLSFNVTFSGSHCSVVRTSFFFMAGQYFTFCLCNHLYKCWGFLHYLAIISNDATNILVNFWACMFSYLLCRYQEWTFCHMIIICLTIWGSVRLSSKVATPVYIPISNVWRFQFLHLLTTTCFVFLKSVCCSWVGAMKRLIWFWLTLPEWLLMLSLCSCACGSFLHLL